MNIIELEIKTSKQMEILDITPQINKALQENNIADGICFIYSPHTTCGLMINEHADPTVAQDIMETLNQLVPVNGTYHHLEENSHAHIKTMMVGSSVHLIIENMQLRLGTWQGVFLCEFDGPRRRRVWIKPIKG
ncbi:MAG: secondary thiamine-phosphate synthase enzyme YjbQ [Thermacetogeniaceae bacterium]